MLCKLSLICMKCQTLLSEEIIKKNRINNLSSAKLTQRVLRFKNDITLYKNLCLNIHCESHIIYTLV